MLLTFGVEAARGRRPRCRPAMCARSTRDSSRNPAHPDFDHHAHPGFGDDPMWRMPRRRHRNTSRCVSAIPIPSSSSPQGAVQLPDLRRHDGDAAWNGSPTVDGREHAGARHTLTACWTNAGSKRRRPTGSPCRPISTPTIRSGIFVDSFLFPFNNTVVTGANPDEGVYIPLQEKVLHRYMQQAESRSSPRHLTGT